MRKIIRTLSLLLLCCFAYSYGHGQIDQGSITGIVQDSSGAVIPRATVTITDMDTALTLEQQTNASGVYNFTPVKIGRYKVTASAPNFETTVREGVQVNVNARVGVNLVLQAGAVTQTVTVTSSEQLQTEDNSTGQVFLTQTINDTPLDGRNYVFIAQLSTGVAPPNSGFNHGGNAGDFTANGQRASQNNFVLDGVDNNSNLQDFLNGSTYVMRPPPDALQEFAVQTSDYSAELGHSAGAVVNASIKSGTNNFHGSLWEYLRNDKLDALDYFNTTKSAYHQNQFGATFGGPFWKDRLFFFADAEATRISFAVPPQPNNTVPTDAMRNGDFSQLLDPGLTNGKGAIALYQVGGNPTVTAGGPETGEQRYLTCNGQRNVICNVNSVAQGILKLFPEPNSGVPGQVYNNYTIPAQKASDNITQYDVRLDWNPSSKDQAFGRYSYSTRPQYNPPPLGPILDGGGFGDSGSNENQGKNGVISETHFFSPTLSNEFRVGFNWIRATYLQLNSGTDLASQLGLGGIPFYPENGGLPTISFNSINTIGSPQYEPSDEREDVLQILDNVTKVWGRHTLKFGVNFQHSRFFGLQPPNSLGSESFSGAYTSDPGQPNATTGSGAADFLLDMMNSSGITSFTQFTDVRWYRAAFAQDDWKINPRLTVNLGLRYEYAQPIMEAHDHQANFIGNFANNNQGSGTYLLPESQKSYAMPPALLEAFAKDNIQVQYTSNRFLVNPDKTNFAPRVGFAYMVSDRAVVRGGFGIFYGGFENLGLGPNIGSNAPFNVSANFNPDPNVCQNVLGDVTCPTTGQTLETGFSEALNTPGGLVNFANLPTVFAADSDAKTPYSEGYNLTFQHALTNTISWQIGYVGNVDRHLQMSYSANQYAGNRIQGANMQLLQPFFDLGTVEPIVNRGVSRYDSLQAKLERRYTQGLGFLASYTWAHCLDDAFEPIGQSEQGGYRNPNFLGFGYDYGACTQDVRQRFTFSPQYELPFGHGKRFLNRTGLVDAVAGGWKTSWIFQMQTGNPVFLNATNGTGGYPLRIGDPFSPGGTPDSATQPNFVCATKTHSLQSWYNPCAFANPPRATLGPSNAASNLINYQSAGTIPYGAPGRVSVTGPGFNKIDVSLFKSFDIPFHESQVHFRADVFNLLNHPSFGYPNNGLQGNAASQITSTRFSGESPDARVIQFALRYSF